MTEYEELGRDLVALGRAVDTPEAATLRTAVLERVAGLPTPVPSRRARLRRTIAEHGRRLWRTTVVAGAAVLVALLLTPPVRATVADWFGFAGVVVEHGPDVGDDAPPPPAVDADMSVDTAAELAGFTPLVPTELGEPEAVEVSEDHVVVSLGWSTDEGPVRLDQFDGSLDWRFAKTSPGVVYAQVGGTDALWFERPHEVVVLDEEGNPRTESARLAGHTLIWPEGDITLRLEGDLSLQRALEIAESAAPHED